MTGFHYQSTRVVGLKCPTGLREDIIDSLRDRDAVTQSVSSPRLYAARHGRNALDVLVHVGRRVELVDVKHASTVEDVASVERACKVVLVYTTRQLPRHIIITTIISSSTRVLAVTLASNVRFVERSRRYEHSQFRMRTIQKGDT